MAVDPGDERIAELLEVARQAFRAGYQPTWAMVLMLGHIATRLDRIEMRLEDLVKAQYDG